MIEYNPSLEFHWGWMLIALIAVGMVIVGHMRRMDKVKDINITLWIENEIDDDELQAKFVNFLDTLEDVEQYEVTVENVEPS